MQSCIHFGLILIDTFYHWKIIASDGLTHAGYEIGIAHRTGRNNIGIARSKFFHFVDVLRDIEVNTPVEIAHLLIGGDIEFHTFVVHLADVLEASVVTGCHGYGDIEQQVIRVTVI